MKQGFNTPEELAATTQQVFDYIKAYQDEHGYPPSRRDIAAHLGSVASTAQEHLKRLVDQGIITVTPGIPRGIRITGSVGKTATEAL